MARFSRPHFSREAEISQKLCRWQSGSQNVAGFIGSILLLLTLLLLLTSCLSRRLPPVRTPAERCGLLPSDLASASQSKPTVELTVWSQAYANSCWRAYLPLLAAKDVDEYAIVVKVPAIAMQHRPYRRLIEDAAAAGIAPDIVFVPTMNVAKQWVDAGYLTPLDECVARHSEFNGVVDELWNRHEIQGKTWLLPIENRLENLFFSKRKLRELGWREADIASLPEAIRKGEFTLDDLITLAQQAVERGVVERGYAFWPDVDRRQLFGLLYNTYSQHTTQENEFGRQIDRDALIQTFTLFQQIFEQGLTPPRFVDVDRRKWIAELIRQDFVGHGRVLFWVAPNYDWASLVSDFAYPYGGQSYVHETIGYALFPAAVTGQSGSVLWLGSGFYGIVSTNASGRNYQDTACALLAKTFNPALLTKLTALSATASTLKLSFNELHTSSKSRYQAETEYMLAYAQTPPAFSQQIAWLDSVIFESIILVEKGVVSPTDAADTVLRALDGKWIDATIP